MGRAIGQRSVPKNDSRRSASVLTFNLTAGQEYGPHPVRVLTKEVRQMAKAQRMMAYTGPGRPYLNGLGVGRTPPRRDREPVGDEAPGPGG